MIGLVDYDLQTSALSELTPPNLEIMKLANYYKIEENKFCRLVSLKEEDLSNYSQIYFFSETAREPDIPEAFKTNPNVIYGGSAFTNEQYVPFANDLIDYTLPSPMIYKNFLKEKYDEGIKSNVIEHILDDSYYRQMAGDKKLPIPPVKKRKRVYIYDRDFFAPDWEKNISILSDRHPSSIITIHPIHCKTLTQYFNLRNFPKLSRANGIILDVDVPYDDIPYLLKKYLKLFLADISTITPFYIAIGGNLKSNRAYYTNLIKQLNLLYSFWAKSVPVKIYYIKPGLGYNNPLDNLFKALELWTRSFNKDKTINDRIVYKKKKIQIERDERDELLKFYPTAATLFDQSFNAVSSRGYWRI